MSFIFSQPKNSKKIIITKFLIKLFVEKSGKLDYFKNIKNKGVKNAIRKNLGTFNFLHQKSG